MTASRCDQLDEYLDDELDEVSARGFRHHLAECASCQLRLHERMQLIARMERAVDRAQAAPQAPRRKPARRARQPAPIALFVTAGALSAAAMLLLVVGPRLRAGSRPATVVESGAGDAAAAWLASITTRADEAWLGEGAIGRYRPYTAPMAADAARPTAPPQVESALEQRRDWLTLAALRAWQGDHRSAGGALARMPEDAPGRRSLAANVERADRRPDKALAILDGVIDAHPAYLPAWWNRALVLSDLGLDLGAADSFRRVAESRSPEASGWSDEARLRATAHDREVGGRYADAFRAELAGQDMMDAGKAMPPSVVKASPALARHFLYHALNTATSRDRVQALLPVAEQLDRLNEQGPVLRRAVERVLRADFSVRAPLARRYLALYKDAPGETPDRLARDAARLRDPLFEAGVLSMTPLSTQMVAAYEEQAQKTADAWWITRAQEARAQLLLDEDDPQAAQLYLARAIAGCRPEVKYHCALLSRLLTAADRKLRQPDEAMRLAREGLSRARSNGEWATETYFLEEVAAIGRQRADLGLAQAASEELILRGALERAVRRKLLEEAHASEERLRDSEARAAGVAIFAHQNAAQIALDQLRADVAERHLAAVPEQPRTRWLTTAALLADTHSLRPAGPAGARALRLVEQHRAESLGLGQAELALVEARALMERDPARATVQAGAALKLIAAGVDRRDARRELLADAYALLIHGASLTSDWSQALDLFAAEQSSAAPARCAVGISQDFDRLAVVVRDAEGRLRGRLQPGFRAALTAARLGDWALLDGLEGCPEVDVLARPPLLGRPDLLPPELPWRYRTAAAPATPAPSPRDERVLVTGVRPPASADLLPLPLWPRPDGPEPAGPLVLSGPRATPGHVLDRIRTATEVLIQAHGIVDAEVSNVSYLALSPDDTGRYALTARQILDTRLEGHPLVILAACRAAEPGPYRRQPWSLPVAFLQSGARAVVASTSVLDAREAEPFFEELRRDVRAGRSPAVALRDARRRAMALRPDTTLRQVMLFQ